MNFKKFLLNVCSKIAVQSKHKTKTKKDLNTCKYHGLEREDKKITIQHFQMSLEPTKINKHIIGYLQFLG